MAAISRVCAAARARPEAAARGRGLRRAGGRQLGCAARAVPLRRPHRHAHLCEHPPLPAAAALQPWLVLPLPICFRAQIPDCSVRVLLLRARLGSRPPRLTLPLPRSLSWWARAPRWRSWRCSGCWPPSCHAAFAAARALRWGDPPARRCGPGCPPSYRGPSSKRCAPVPQLTGPAGK